jgi:hypothetical protein
MSQSSAFATMGGVFRGNLDNIFKFTRDDEIKPFISKYLLSETLKYDMEM